MMRRKQSPNPTRKKKRYINHTINLVTEKGVRVNGGRRWKFEGVEGGSFDDMVWLAVAIVSEILLTFNFLFLILIIVALELYNEYR